MKKLHLSLLPVLGALTALLLTATASAAPFTPGNLAVVRFDGGGAALAGVGTAVFIDEYTTAGGLVQSIPIPPGGATALVVSGSATSEGALMRSPSGRFLCFAGYNAPVGTAGIVATTSAAVPREIALMEANGTYTVPVSTMTQFSASNIRSGASDGLNNFWGSGGNSGTYYFGLTAGVATVQNASLNTRVNHIQNGNLCFSAGAGTRGIYIFTGTPTAAAAPTLLIPTGANSSPYGFAISPSGTFAYVADDTPGAAGGVQRWNLVGATWTLAYTLGSGVANIGARGLVVDWSGADPVIYATTGEATTSQNRLIRIVDTGAASAAVTLATSGATRAFRGVAFSPLGPPTIACPPAITVPGTSAAGAVVTYPAPTVVGGCLPVSVACNPPSGSTFPVGNTVVTCVANSSCGAATCTFTVTVTPPPPPVGLFPTNTLPPPNGVYISPQLYHQLYANGIIISNISHRRFTGGEPPPQPGQVKVHLFDSIVEMQVSMGMGQPFMPAMAPAQVSVMVNAAADGMTYNTEMLSLNISGGSLPPGVMIRESPTLASTGQTTVRPVAGGYYAIGSFFDIFTEISLDGGANWSPAGGPAHVELRTDPTTITPIPAPTPILPPPNDKYVSPRDFHLALASGIVISNVSHRFFTQSLPPPEPNSPPRTHSFDSQVDMMLSMGAGSPFMAVRAPAAVSVRVAHRMTPPDGTQTQIYDTEMLALNIQGGDLPPGVMLRESPTRASVGGTAISLATDGTFRIGSFFDIFTEVSLDGGANWQPAGGPAHVELQCTAPEVPKPTPNLPPPDGTYISPQLFHALYANGVIIKNISHDRFNQSQPPPLPGNSQTHEFGSQVSFQVSMDGGATFSPASAPAHVMVRVDSSIDAGDTRYFNTEMLSLDISGGSLPAGVMVRESPSKASLGRTSIRMVNDPATGIWDYISSFFDVFTEISLDGGANWSPAANGPAEVALRNPLPPIGIACPPDITAAPIGPLGAVVTYSVLVNGGCDAAPTIACNPPSGSTFPIGTTTVTCVASDSCGQSATCSFKVTVRSPRPWWFPQPNLPPLRGEYISPQRWHQLYANGIIISNVSHRRFLQNFSPPAPGTSDTHSFGSEIAGEVSLDGGMTFMPLTGMGNADVTVKITHVGTAGTTQLYDTEMLSLTLMTANGLKLRESPSKASLGRTRITPNPGGGFEIDSFFDVFTEISLDGGVMWSPAQQAAHVELRGDPQQIPPIVAPTPLLPPPVDLYVSPQQFHLLLSQGIVIRNVRHKLFTQSLPPPKPGLAETHSFGSQVDMELSMDNGNTFRPMRAPAQVAVSLQHRRSDPDGTQSYDTEMLQLSISGGDLPPNVMIRESPTLPSLGGTAVAPTADGQFRIDSFFDVFTEVSLDGGASWQPASGPAHVELICEAPPIVTTNPNLPPLEGQYVSPEKWHALFAQGIIISNVSHKRFTDTFQPPPPGLTDTHSFGSQVECDLSLDGGQTFQHTMLPAQVMVSVREQTSSGDTRFFETEMLSLNIQGGGLPPGVMIRESPSKASLGRTSIRMVNDPATGIWDYISSFFDVFTELSTDGGANWTPAASGPGTVHVAPLPLAIVCPPDKTLTASGPAGAVVNYATPTTSGGCPPVTVVCNPPSGSTFPVGTTTVTCIARDICNGIATCTFKVIVRPPVGDPCLEPDSGAGTVILPPADCQYLSPDQVHMIIDGLPPGTTIELAAIHKDFICHTNQGGAGVCSFNSLTCREPGGALGGEKECADSTLVLTLHGTGALLGFDRVLPLPVGFETHVGPRTPGQPVQSFDTEMFRLSGQITGDPDFDLLRITAGNDFGLPSPGHTTLTRLPGGNWAVDSFFDITYRIDFVGHPGGRLAGRSGSTTATIRMVAVQGTACVTIACPSNIVAWTCANTAVVNYSVGASNACGGTVTVTCTPPSGSPFPVGVTTVNCTATGLNAAGQPAGTATCNFTVTVTRDVKPPTLTCPNSISVRTCADREIVFYVAPTATDDCDPAPVVTCLPPSGSVFPAGSTAVNCTARDACGNKTNCTFTVVVIPEPLPKLTIQIVNGQLLMCWTTPCPGYRIQCSRGLETPILWENLANIVTTVNGTNCVTVPLQTTSRRFYRLVRNTAQEVFSSTDTLPPVGSYNSSPNEVTVFPPTTGLANGVIARWFIHRIPPLPCPPNCPVPPCALCPDPTIFNIATTLEVQDSLDGGLTFQNGSGQGTTRVSVHGGPNGQMGPVRFLDTEMLSMDITFGGTLAGVMLRESPTLASTGKHVIRTIDGGFRIGSFFDVFLEISINGGQSWLPAQTPVHVDYNALVPDVAATTDNFPPVGTYADLANVPTYYGNGVIGRNFRHRILPLPCPPMCPPPCLTCPPQPYDFPTTLTFDFSIDDGKTFQSMTLPVQTRALARHSEDTATTRFFDVEIVSLNPLNVPPGGIMLRESPSLPSKGKTSVRQAPAPPGGYRIDSFFDVFTELSTDGGATWSPVVNPTHLELQSTTVTP